MPNQIFELEKIVSNPNYQIAIHLGKGRSNIVTGFITDSINMGGGNEWNNPFESTPQNVMADLINKFKPAVASGISAYTGQETTLPFTTMKSVEQSALGWVGSKKPSFNIPLAFVAVRPGDDVTDPIKKLAQSIFPSEEKIGVGSIGVGIAKAPLDYSLTVRGGKLVPKGVITVRIGRWFFATKQVITNVNWTFSKEVISSGLPYMATATVEFEPYKNITLTEFYGYFNAGSLLQ